MRLTFMVTARCNASCGHCGTDCGPSREESLSKDRIIRLMDEAAALANGEPLHFGLTGGEVFLDLALLLDLVRHGKSLGAWMGCVSNASWATSDERALPILEALAAAGLRSLNVSTSVFHREFVPASRVERALRLARQVGIDGVLKVVRLASDPMDDEAIRAWGTTMGASRVQVFPLFPHLRTGRRVEEPEYVRSPGIPDDRCPSMQITVDWNGEAYNCCTPGGFQPFYSLGNTATTPLPTVRHRFFQDGKRQILRQSGPAYFAKAIAERGLAGRLRGSYAGICDLCTHIATDPVLASAADEAAARYEMAALERLLDSLVDATPHDVRASRVDA